MRRPPNSAGWSRWSGSALARSSSGSSRPGGLIRLDGEIDAEVEQTCVVTLEPFRADLRDRFTLFFSPHLDPQKPRPDMDMPLTDEMLADEAWPEPIEDGRIDLGEAVAQQFSLVLDPHPRAPGAVLDGASLGDDPDEDNPFRALADRLSGGKKGG